jgi:type IV pilus assembly protein PilY1
MYYQSLRYLQGLAPTPDAVSNITTDMQDGFPVYTSWPEDPYGGARSVLRTTPASRAILW